MNAGAAERIAKGQKHVEAFCLMRYECAGLKVEGGLRGARPKGCGHHEIIWNSRDGVTPFITQCPSCGGDLLHAYFASDKYALDHKPHRGQRIWRDGTLAEWEKVFLARLLDADPLRDRKEAEQIANGYARDEVDRHSPWLDVTGYVPKP